MSTTKDYGCDPLPDGTFRMVPSGDVVSSTEKEQRLGKRDGKQADCIGLTWEEIARRQGGLNTLDITREKKGKR